MPKRIMQGVVESNKSQNTLVIRVERKYKHPLYKKIIKQSKKYSVHYDEGVYELGDIVKVVESSPISKTKKWKIIK